jgi:Ca-activated chloride channel homolog
MKRYLAGGLLYLQAILLIAMGSFAPSPASAQDADAPVRLRVDLVPLEAEVIRKKSGEAVSHLTKDDFIITEDGVRQTLSHFSREPRPLAVLLLLDVSASVQPIIERVSEEGMQALAQLRPDDTVAVMAFGRWATVTQPFTIDRQQIIDRIGDIQTMSEWIRAATYIDDAAYEAARYMSEAANPDSRRVIIMITDNESNQPFYEGHQERESLEALARANAVFCGLLVGKFAAAERHRKQGFTEKDNIGPFVSESGGVVAKAEKADAVMQLTKLIERMRTRYSLAYMPLNMNRDGKFRKIKLSLSPDVEKREGKIEIKTRSGYYAPKADSGGTPAVEKPPAH